eukprot:2144864-Amphidinium_carterae.1
MATASATRIQQQKFSLWQHRLAHLCKHTHTHMGEPPVPGLADAARVPVTPRGSGTQGPQHQHILLTRAGSSASTVQWPHRVYSVLATAACRVKLYALHACAAHLSFPSFLGRLCPCGSAWLDWQVGVAWPVGCRPPKMAI